jgi:hypothetical protein
MTMFKEFHAGDFPLYNLNFGIITLLPKQKEAKQIQQYRPICMVNVSFKIFMNVLANRVVRPLQTDFSKDEYHGGVVVLHETTHEIYKKVE